MNKKILSGATSALKLVKILSKSAGSRASKALSPVKRIGCSEFLYLLMKAGLRDQRVAAINA